MDANSIRDAYLKFFSERNHQIIARALLVPQNDPTTLFTGSGMQPLIPYLLGQPHPEGTKLVNSQTCLRAQDIDEVGDNRHTTFFEMLGNWSLGEYFKREQISWFFEFLTDVVGLDPNRLFVTSYIGNKENGINRDEETAKIWQKLFEQKGIEAKIAVIGSKSDGDVRGIKQGERIFYYDDGENWWSRAGGLDSTPVGDPCGPDSEVFYDFGEAHHDSSFGKAHPASDSGRFMEIGNQVFMQYKRTKKGFELLVKPNVDFGGGLERIAAAAIDSPDVYKISLLWPIIEKLQQISGKQYDSYTNNMRVIADHLRGAVFLAVDGVKPSNKEQGYVMRRLIRRAIRFAFELGVQQNFMSEITPVITNLYKAYPEVVEKNEETIDILTKEEKAFRQTLSRGLKELHKMVANHNILSGEQIFTLYDTYGFPAELSVEEVYMRGQKISSKWQQEFNLEMAKQKKRSQTAAKGAFKGGLGGQTMQHKKYHTATHLLYQALRDVLGDHIIQRGSNITEERLRFDFSHPDKMTNEQIQQVEDIVNKQIANDLQISWEEYPTQVAINEKGALGQFGDRYGDTVKVYKMQASNADKPYSFEICGGPHVDHSLQLFEGGNKFKIIKEQSSSAGVRRIKAVLA